uniref:Myb/SANT-like domain-containing protein n=1 Tax=Oryza punctata TaxID=4537 RepID=A0A0E0MK33_ORYPU
MIFSFPSSHGARPPQLLTALGFGAPPLSIPPSVAAATLHPALGRNLHLVLGRCRSPSLLPRSDSPAAGEDKKLVGKVEGNSLDIKEQFKNAQGTNSRMAHEIKRRREEDDDMMLFVFPALISPKASLLQQQQRHLQKKASPKSYNTQKKKVSPKAQQSRASWNPGLEKALVDLLHEHNNPHYRCQNGWTSEAWNKVVKEFRDRHPYVTMNKQQIQDKEKELKRDYRLLKEARKQSGASWDHQRCMIIADDAVWANIIQGSHTNTTSRANGEKNVKKNKSISRERVEKTVKRNKRNDVVDMMGSYLEMRKRQSEEEEAKKREEASKVDDCSIRNCITVVETMEELSNEEKVKSFGVFKDAQNREIFMSAGPMTRLMWLRTMLTETSRDDVYRDDVYQGSDPF